MKIKKFINKKPYLISGPCSAESENQVLEIAKSIEDTVDVFRAGVWKPRTNPNSFEGAGREALNWLKSVREETSLKVITEVATPKHVEFCLNAGIDMLWIGARTTVNPFYVQEIAEALKGTDIPIFVKNPIHPELGLWIGALERLNKSGVTQLAAIHRGFYSYEKLMFRNDPRWEILIKLKEKIQNIPIICDPSHIAGKTSIIKEISQTAMDLNLDGLIIECHSDPLGALSDSKQQLTPKELRKVMKNLVISNTNLCDKLFKKELLELRDRIDFFDKKIIQALNKRKEIVEEIGKFKQKNKLTIFQLERWFEILSTRKEIGNDLGLNKQMIAEFFTLIHKYSIATQTKVMRKK